MKKNIKMNSPIISIAIPTFNEEEMIGKCLSSIFKQDYPRDKFEVIVLDNYSTDNTTKIVKKFPVKLYRNKIRDISHSSKMLALRKARGDFFLYLDADLEILGNQWLNQLLEPLLEDVTIAASFTKFVAFPDDPPICRYLSYDITQRDPIFEFFSPSVESTITEWRQSYAVCEYRINKIPPTGVCIFRKKILLELWNTRKDQQFMELDNLAKHVLAGYTKFAFVPNAGMHHPFVNNLNDVFSKRLRNIGKTYLPHPSPRLYAWVNIKTPRGLLQIALWMIYVNTFILPILRGVKKSLKYKDWACMYEPILAFSETWVIIYGVIYYSIKKLR